jgi:hypothetical protein
VEPFRRDVTRVRTEQGEGLIDRRGQIVVPPGRYKSLYPWDKTPLIDAFRAGEPNCADYLRQDGKVIRQPRGICPGGADDLVDLGYAYVHDGEQRRGIVDARGQLLIRPAYPWLQGINDRYLLFGNAPVRPTQFGVIDRRGRIVLPSGPIRIATWNTSNCCLSPGLLRGAFLGTTAEGTGLLALDGRWIVPPRYKEATMISPDLVALRDQDGLYRFFSSAGQPIALTSTTAPYRLRTDDDKGRPELFSFTRVAGPGQASASLKGVMLRYGLGRHRGHSMPLDNLTMPSRCTGLPIPAIKHALFATGRSSQRDLSRLA